MNSIKPIAFAHRGGNEKYPENTIEAFSYAYHLGYRYFETDVYLTKDKELIAFHDKSLGRLLKENRSVTSLSKVERNSYLINNKYSIPLLADLLERFPDCFFNIDAKSPDSVKSLADVIKQYQAINRVCIASFNSQSLLSLRRLLPDTITAVTRNEYLKLRYTNWSTPIINHNFVEIPAYISIANKNISLVTAKSIKTLHNKNCKVLVWTINNEQQMNELLDIGVDGIFSSKPLLLKKVLEKRGQW